MSAASQKTPPPPVGPSPASGPGAGPAVAKKPSFDPHDPRFNREVIRGVEMMSPRPARRHVRTEGRLMTEVASRFDGPRGRDRDPGGWMIVVEPELHLEGSDPVIPDLAGWRRERAPADTNEAAYYTAPDWVCEILSPSTRTWDREKKMPLYAFHRVGHLWMADPLTCELEVFALGRRGWELIATYSGDGKIRAEPFDEVELPLSRIWPDPPPPPASE